MSGGEQPVVTFGEAFTVQPFGNLLVTMDLTGAQLHAVLEQQAIATRSRPVLILGVCAARSATGHPRRSASAHRPGVDGPRRRARSIPPPPTGSR
ncbi:MAG: 5'-nucleotidase C-terminal domain-containing protein [Acidimicrobiales bacterium]